MAASRNILKSLGTMHNAIRDNLAAAGDFVRSANGMMRVIVSP